MRISTNMIYQNSGSQIADLQSSLNQTMEQISAGRKILTPADDPIGSARALVITQAAAINDQYAVNRQDLQDNLGITSGVLSNVTNLLQSTKSTIISAGNGALADSDRLAIATTLKANLASLVSLANSTDGTGNYLFAGFSTTTMPYSQTASGATYNGDQGQRYLQVNTARQLPLSTPGDQVFGNIRTSANQFNVQPDPSNAGTATATATIDPATAANLTGNNYTVTFDNTGANFSVVNTTTGAAVALTNAATGAAITQPVPYVSGQGVKFDGMNVVITGGPPSTTPAPGDKYTIQPGNQNIFETLTDAINALSAPTGNSAARKSLTAALTQANNNVDASLSNVLTVSAQIGSSLQEVDSLNNVGASTKIAYAQSLSSIQDLDYAKAITSLNQQQTTLQAAQQSFVKISALSLFSYIN
ncbi:flagellar hook-associated protein FlgL [Undibacterium sp. SXout20W]|uniref:flagellar hook-associated protein FlgL n=1 Tax=Undibacterium sp. SXout20W TaxID=3413051 RepID=UPI003BF10F64